MVVGELISTRQLNILFLRKGIFYAIYFLLIEGLILFGKSWFTNAPCEVDPYRLKCEPDQIFLELDGCTNFLFTCSNTDLFPGFDCESTCQEIEADKATCEARKSFQNYIYFFLLFFNLLSGVYLYMSDFDLVKNNVKRSKLISVISKMVDKKSKKKKKKDDSDGSGEENGIEMVGMDPLPDEAFNEYQEEFNEKEREKTPEMEVEIGMEVDEPTPSSFDDLNPPGEEDEMLDDKHFCAWDYYDLCFLLTTIFLNVLVILYTAASFLTKPPYCSGGKSPSVLDKILYSFLMLVVMGFLALWGFIKYHLSKLKAKWNNRRVESKVFKVLHFCRYTMIFSALAYLIVDLTLFFLSIFHVPDAKSLNSRLIL